MLLYIIIIIVIIIIIIIIIIIYENVDTLEANVSFVSALISLHII